MQGACQPFIYCIYIAARSLLGKCFFVKSLNLSYFGGLCIRDSVCRDIYPALRQPLLPALSRPSVYISYEEPVRILTNCAMN